MHMNIEPSRPLQGPVVPVGGSTPTTTEILQEEESLSNPPNEKNLWVWSSVLLLVQKDPSPPEEEKLFGFKQEGRSF